MNLHMIKFLFINGYVKFFFMSIIIFFTMDIIFSNSIIKSMIKKDCFKYMRYTINNQNYYSYELEKNCKAYETKRTVKTYNVYTDENGYRVGSKKNVNKVNKENTIVFLGDSFTYGLGVNYEDSIVGILEKKGINYNTLNLAVPGYSPVISKVKLEQLIKKGVRPKKIFYIMDITDVHDESNRWIKKEELEYPVIIGKEIGEEIEKAFNYKKHFKMTRIAIYNLNKIMRNLRKEINKKNFIEEDKIIGKTHGGSFTHTPYDKLDKDFWSHNDYKNGIVSIKNNVKLISDEANKINSDFYIVIYPWPETLEYGEEYFSWQNFAFELCEFSKCKKLISAFPEFKKVKKKFTHWKKEIYFLNDIHFNVKGNRILADIIYHEALKH